MRARVLRVSPEFPEPAPVADAARVLRAGGLVAFPTETVYGLGADALSPEAVGRIFAAKGRPATNPLIAHVADVAATAELVAAWPDAAARLADRFWPGPLTLVLPKRAVVPDAVTAGLPAVAVRVPAHPVARALIRAAGCPVAAPSANRYTELSPTRAEHVARSLGDSVDVILDAGPTDVGIESTVVDLTGARPAVLRPGMISHAEIAEVVGPVEVGDGPVPDDAARLSPGLAARHYAPAATVLLVPRGHGARSAAGRERLARPVAALVLDERGLAGAGVTPDRVVTMPAAPDLYARELYDTLHTLDAEGFRTILVEEVPPGARWAGVRDRLVRAAHPGG